MMLIRNFKRSFCNNIEVIKNYGKVGIIGVPFGKGQVCLIKYCFSFFFFTLFTDFCFKKKREKEESNWHRMF